MNRLSSTLLAISFLSAGLSVALGAFAAHALKSRLSERMLEVFQTGVEYRFNHSLGLMVLALVLTQAPDSLTRKALQRASALMIAGVFLFSGSLYVLAVSGVRSWGMVTPVGGVLLIASWLVAAYAMYRMKTRKLGE